MPDVRYKTPERLPATKRLIYALAHLLHRKRQLVASRIAMLAAGDFSLASNQTALLGLSLTVLCLVGAAKNPPASADLDDESSLGFSTGNVLSVCYRRSALFLLDIIYKASLPVRLILGSAWAETDTDDSSQEEDVIDTTVIQHSGCCQCESVAFQVSCYRCLVCFSKPFSR